MGKNKNKPKKAQLQTTLDDLVDKLLYSCSTQHSSAKEEWSNILEIQQLLDKINDIEKDNHLPSYNRYENLDSFLTWAKENGANWEGIKIEKINGKDLGIIAEKELKESDLYLTVPRKLMLSSENASAKVGNLVRKDVVLRAMPNVLLAFYLLIEACDSDSFWKPYISILPSSFSTVLYFTTKELEELQSSPTLAEAINLQRSIARQYAYLYKLFHSHAELKSLNAKKCFSYNLYRWAVSCVMTRQNAIPRKSKRRTRDGSQDDAETSKVQDQLKSLALVPLWDLCNNEIGKFSTDFNTTKDELECYAMKTFNANEEVTMFYGPRPNSELFIHSGFIIPSSLGNCYDTYSIKLGISNNDPLSNDKNLLCEKLGLPSKGTFMIRANDKPVDEMLLNFCKVSTMTKDNLEVFMAKMDNLLSSFTNDETLNEKALEFLHMRLSILLRSYKTSIEDDEALLLENTANENTRLAISMRLSEKQLLKKVITISSVPT